MKGGSVAVDVDEYATSTADAAAVPAVNCVGVDVEAVATAGCSVAFVTVTERRIVVTCWLYDGASTETIHL